MTRFTLYSLPGMAWALRITRSPSWIFSHLFSPAAMSAMADMGSPCEPVETTHTFPGGEVELEVAGVEDHALGRVEGGGEAVRHRVADRDELAVEGTDLAPLAVLDRDELGAVEQARFLDPVAGEPEGQRRAVDREGQ